MQETRSQVFVARRYPIVRGATIRRVRSVSAWKVGLQTEIANDDARSRGYATACCSSSQSLVDLQYNPGILIRR